MKCPYCQSERLRRSRHRTEDGLWQSLFYTSYRCRGCGQRSQHLTSGVLLVVTSVAALGAVFGLGFSIGALRDGPERALELVARDTSGPKPASADAEGPASPATVEASLAAAAEAGDPWSQLRLGLGLLNGNSGKRDAATGLMWIEKAADQGYSEAQYTLGNIYLTGRGALQSFPHALERFEQAAQQNHAEAQYQLGMMYRIGQGVAIDKSKAYIWFNLAAAQGHERARDSRDALLPQMPADQVLAAQRAAREWRPVTTGP